MRKTFLLISAVFLAACVHNQGSTIQADFRFSEAGGLGIQNAAGYQPGSVFRWDIQTNQLIYLDDISLNPAAHDIPGFHRSISIAGVEVANLPTALLGERGALSAAVAAQSEFMVEGAYRHSYSAVWTALSRYANSVASDGHNAELIFRPNDPNSRIVVVNSVYRAQNSLLRVGGADASDENKVAEVTFPSPIGGVASVRVRAGSSTACGATSDTAPQVPPACFFNVMVVDPYLNDQGKIQWDDVVSEYSRERLRRAFRR
jgi:hypothetical protein